MPCNDGELNKVQTCIDPSSMIFWSVCFHTNRERETAIKMNQQLHSRQSPMFIHNRHCKWFTWEKSLVQFYDFVHIFRGIMKNPNGSDVHADLLWCAQLDYVCSAPIPSFTALLLIPLQHQFGNGNSLEISFSFETWEQNLSYKISSLLYSEMAIPWNAILLWKVVN